MASGLGWPVGVSSCPLSPATLAGSPSAARPRSRASASTSCAASAILCSLTLKEVYRLPLRGVQGLLSSVFELMQVALAVPNYTTLSRRSRTLVVTLPRTRRAEGLHLVIDSSGFKVYG